MNLLFVTVGTSALDNPEVGQAPDRRDNKTLRGDLDRYRRSADKSLERWSKLLGDVVQAHKRYWEQAQFYILNWENRKQTSAELTSTMSLLRDATEHGFRPPDKLVLLASDTEEGELAAKVNEAVFRTLHPWMTFAVSRVKNLNVKFADFTRSIEGLVNEHQESGADRVVFNVTGGYKGAIPCITALARDKGWLLYCQHEDAGYGVYLQFEDGKLRSEPKPFGRVWS